MFSIDTFFLRRTVERLRDGLFDPLGVQFLTVEKDRIETIFSENLKALEKKTSNTQCLCGSYGQGKSHTLAHLNQLALAQGYATSFVSLDPRTTAFHQFATVYQAIMQGLSLKDELTFASAWKRWANKDCLELLESMPHRFKMILTAMLCKNKVVAKKKNSVKKQKAYRSKKSEDSLNKALMGYDVPTGFLKKICKDREIEGCLDQSLICRGNAPYFQMIQSLGKVLNEMGYKGLVLFFDEAESITQARINHRAKSYHLLDQFFQTKNCVFPVFAFTHDFFDKVHQELYDVNREVFAKNYAEAWQGMPIAYLPDFSSREWEYLIDRLMQLYAQAYQIELPLALKPTLQSLLEKLENQETRYKLKALIYKLDTETQHTFLTTSM